MVGGAGMSCNSRRTRPANGGERQDPAMLTLNLVQAREVDASPGVKAPLLWHLVTTLPAATLADLQKDDAVMLVATQGTQGGGVTAITLLGGVEAILQASPGSASTILSPWSLGSGAPGGEAGTP